MAEGQFCQLAETPSVELQGETRGYLRRAAGSTSVVPPFVPSLEG